MNNTQIIAIIVMIVILGIYLFFTSPWRDAKADAAAAGATMVGGAYLLRKYMKHKKKNNKNRK
jgi:hypothetical protein